MTCWFLVVLDNKKRIQFKSSQFPLWHLRELKLDSWCFIYLTCNYQFNSHSLFIFGGKFFCLLIHQNIIMHLHFFMLVYVLCSENLYSRYLCGCTICYCYYSHCIKWKNLGIYIFYEFAKFIMAVIVRCIF